MYQTEIDMLWEIIKNKDKKIIELTDRNHVLQKLIDQTELSKDQVKDEQDSFIKLKALE